MTTLDKLELGITYLQRAARVYMKTENPEDIDPEKMQLKNTVIEEIFTTLTNHKLTQRDITKVILSRAFEE